jgi:hypothetical protein
VADPIPPFFFFKKNRDEKKTLPTWPENNEPDRYDRRKILITRLMKKPGLFLARLVGYRHQCNNQS